MKKNIQIALTLLGITGVILIGVAIYYNYFRVNNINLKPGFKRWSASFKPTLSKEISEKTAISKCLRYDRDGEPEYFPPGSELYSYSQRHKLVLEEDFTTPVTITVIATASDTKERDPDPAIIIKSQTEKILICDDTEEPHGIVESLNSKDRVINKGGGYFPGFVAERGTYYLEIWSYYQSMKDYELIITESK